MGVRLDELVGELELAVQREANLVLRALRCALNALEEQDGELAREVIAFDDEIDDLYRQIHESIHGLLASQAPVAVDLRQALGILHVNLHLERAADESVTVAKLAGLSADCPRDASLLAALSEMGARAEEMIRVAVDAFLRHDLAGAESLIALDELIDRANRRVTSRVLELGSDPSLREWGLRMMIVSRALERIGDHAVDIGEQTAYMITGEFCEFTDASRREDA